MENEDELKSFHNDIRDIFTSIEVGASDIILFTGDNSFVQYSEDLVKLLSRDIENAMLGQPVEEKSESMFWFINRFIDSFSHSSSFRIINANVHNVFENLNTLILNWVRMVRETNLFKEVRVSPENCDYIVKKINVFNSILAGSESLDLLASMVNSLIDKASQVLSSEPRAFDLSRSFAKILEKEVDKIVDSRE